MLGFVLTLTAAVVGVWHIASRDRPLHGPRDDGTLGLPHLQRWSDAQPKRRFTWLRESLPLFDFGRIILGIIAIAIVVGLVSGGLFAWRHVTDSPAEEAASSLGAVVTLHARANASSDPATRYALLVEAEQTAEAALEAAPGEQAATIADELASVQQDLDRMTRMVRLESIQPIGSVPATGNPELPALFGGNGKTYLLSDALYEVEIGSNVLVELLAPGETVAGATVGPLLGGAWRGDGPVVVDADRAYSFDPVRGEWDWEMLGTIEGVPVTGEVVSMGVFDLNLYLLDRATGKIFKFSGGDYESDPEDWAQAQATEELMRATDIVVDGNILVLLPNGSILKFFLNSIESLIQPQIQPEFETASALVSTTSGYYIVNASDGRIAQISEDGTLVQQFSPRDPDLAIRDLRDIVVDESTGIALFLAGDRLYTTRLVASQG